jgi:hypothetical protein
MARSADPECPLFVADGGEGDTICSQRISQTSPVHVSARDRVHGIVAADAQWQDPAVRAPTVGDAGCDELRACKAIMDYNGTGVAVSENIQVVSCHDLALVCVSDLFDQYILNVRGSWRCADIGPVIEHEQPRLYCVGDLRQLK